MIKLDTLTKIWGETVLHLFTDPVRIYDRLVLIGDGVKVANQGKKMPGVKSLHQESESNSKGPVYREEDVTIQYYVRDLIWRSADVFIRFVVVKPSDTWQLSIDINRHVIGGDKDH